MCSSSDLRELEGLVKRLVCVGIPCGVGKDPSTSHLSVWIQQDSDFPLALRIFASRATPRRLPHWACVLDSPAPVVKNSAAPATKNSARAATKGRNTASVVLVHSTGTTRTGTVVTMALQCEPQQG